MSGDVRPSFLATACVAVIVSVTVEGMRAQAPTSRAPVSFRREVLPILSNNCFACHGPDEQQRKTRLHLDTPEGAVAQRGAIEPRQAAQHLLIPIGTQYD